MLSEMIKLVQLGRGEQVGWGQEKALSQKVALLE